MGGVADEKGLFFGVYIEADQAVVVRVEEPQAAAFYVQRQRDRPAVIIVVAYEFALVRILA